MRTVKLTLIGLAVSLLAAGSAQALTITNVNNQANSNTDPSTELVSTISVGTFDTGSGSGAGSITITEVYEDVHADGDYLSDRGITVGGDTALTGPLGDALYFDKHIDFDDSFLPTILGGDGLSSITFTFAITNSTGQDWSDFHFQFFNGGADPSDGAGAALDVNSLVEVTSSPFANTDEATAAGSDAGSGFVSLYGGTHADGASQDYVMTINSGSALPDAIVIRQLASVGGVPPMPEPGTVALMGLGLAGLGFSRRRRGRKA